MKLSQHKGPFFALAIFSWHSLVALAGFTVSRWAHGKAEFEEPEVAGSLVFASLLLSILAVGSTFIACAVPTKASGSLLIFPSNNRLEDELENTEHFFEPTPSCAQFFQNRERNAMQSPLAFAVVDGVAVSAMLLYLMFSTHIVAASLCAAGIGLMGLLTAVLTHWRFEQLQDTQQEYRPLNLDL